MPSSEAPRFELLLQQVLDAAGGAENLAKQAQVSEATLNKWINGHYPRSRAGGALKAVHQWALDSSLDYPPHGYPPNGLLGFIDKGASAKRSLLATDDEVVSPPLLARRRSGRGRRATWGAAGMVVLLAIVAGLVWLQIKPSARQPAMPASGPTVTVQNKVAIGDDRLVEDKTPAYLSTVPRAYCADEANSCKIAQTEMDSGAVLIVDCYVVSPFQMHNFDLKDPDVARNPDRAESRLWYHAYRNDQNGFISEVYLRAGDRGGLSLPLCPSATPGQ